MAEGPKNLETDATAEPAKFGAQEGHVPPNLTRQPQGTSTKIDYTAPDGGRFSVITSGQAPNMQVGHNNVMHVIDKGLFMGKGPRQKPIYKAKKSLLKSTAVPGGDAMDIVAQHIGKDWKALGRNLGLSEGELDNVKIDHYMEGQYEVSYQMVRKWKELAYPTELRKLAKSCQSIGRGDICDRLYDRYGDEDD